MTGQPHSHASTDRWCCSDDTNGTFIRAARYAVLSRLLRYPDEALISDLPLIESAVAGPLGDRLHPLIRYLEQAPLLDAQATYVETFDRRRRCCLYLSYYLNGDTRRRGEALWRFADACHAAGYEVADGELADFLPVVLELAACGGEPAAVGLIQEHRAGLVLLGESLRGLRSPYACVIDALEKLLPPADLAAGAAVRLAREGPPAELVGLEPTR